MKYLFLLYSTTVSCTEAALFFSSALPEKNGTIRAESPKKFLLHKSAAQFLSLPKTNELFACTQFKYRNWPMKISEVLLSPIVPRVRPSWLRLRSSRRPRTGIDASFTLRTRHDKPWRQIVYSRHGSAEGYRDWLTEKKFGCELWLSSSRRSCSQLSSHFRQINWAPSRLTFFLPNRCSETRVFQLQEADMVTLIYQVNAINTGGTRSGWAPRLHPLVFLSFLCPKIKNNEKSNLGYRFVMPDLWAK